MAVGHTFQLFLMHAHTVYSSSIPVFPSKARQGHSLSLTVSLALSPSPPSVSLSLFALAGKGCGGVTPMRSARSRYVRLQHL